MASTYSTNLKLTLMATGDQSGTWGDTTNTNLGTLIEQAVVGYASQAVTDGADTTLTIPDGATSTGRNYIINLTGALTAARNVLVPAVNKPYIFVNATTGGYAVTVKVSGQTGVTIANGKKAIVYCNSTDVIEVANAPVTEAGTQTLTNKTISGSSNTITNVSLTSGVTGTLPVANGGTGAATLTLNNVLLGNGTSAPLTVAPGTSGNVLTSNGTTWASTTPATPAATSGALIRTPQVKTTTGSSTYTTPAGCNTIFIEMLGGGGAGGGNGQSSAAAGCGAGGGYLTQYITVSPSTGYTITVGAGGTVVGNTTGNAGGSTSIVVGATTYTAAGGAGGITNGGAAAAGGTTTNGSTYSFPGTNGGTGNTGVGGTPTLLYFPGGGANGGAGTVGVAATLYGCGGGGAGNTGSGVSRVGAAGFQGFMRIWEFS